MLKTLALSQDGGVVHVRLNRPHVRNALDVQMIAEIGETFTRLSSDDSVRVVVLEGCGSAFCGGADIDYMRAGLDLGEAENFKDALRLSDMFSAIDGCAAPVIAKVHGAALGGGIGLIAVCDIVVAADDAVFGFTEAKLGIVPAVISPFVLKKIGESHARALFTTAERFDAARARYFGLVHQIVPLSAIEHAVSAKAAEVIGCGPVAARVAKDIARTVAGLSMEEARTWTARRIAERRASAEGQEGLRAFLEKRKPTWH